MLYRMNENNGKKIVVVVDDDLPSYQLIEELLIEYDFTIEHFTGGHELMKWIRKGARPDVILMDVQLPGVDGLELTRQIKDIEHSIPVIAYTSYAMPGDRERCLESGCDGYLSKPINVDGFFKVVSGFLFP
jgi:two-component system, cell cycle response regulator DivK